MPKLDGCQSYVLNRGKIRYHLGLLVQLLLEVLEQLLLRLLLRLLLYQILL